MTLLFGGGVGIVVQQTQPSPFLSIVWSGNLEALASWYESGQPPIAFPADAGPALTPIVQATISAARIVRFAFIRCLLQRAGPKGEPPRSASRRRDAERLAGGGLARGGTSRGIARTLYHVGPGRTRCCGDRKGGIRRSRLRSRRPGSPRCARSRSGARARDRASSEGAARGRRRSGCLRRSRIPRPLG